MRHREIPLHTLSLLQHNGQGDLPNNKKAAWEEGQRAWEEEQLDLLC